MVDFGAISQALSVAATVVFFLIPIVILFFKMVDDTFKPTECFYMSLPFVLSLVGILVAGGTPVRFLFWFTGIGYWVGLPIYFFMAERRSNATMLEEDFARCRQLIAFDPHNAAAYAQLGRLYARRQQWEEAVAAYTQAVQLEPENRRYRWSLGKAQAALDRSPERMTSPEGHEPEEPFPSDGAVPPTEEAVLTESPADRVQKALQTLQVSAQECPRCPATPLYSVTWQEIPLQGCGRCGGFWFEKAPLVRLLTTQRGTSSELQALFGRQWSAVRQDRDCLICPHCQAPLQQVTAAQFPNMALQGCPACRRIWLEYGQLEQLEKALPAAPKGTAEGDPAR
jgi:Zn-finger nucleic acid-binding protein